MRIIMVSAMLMCFYIQSIAQEKVLEFTPAVDNYYPFINSYSDADGFNQYYLQDSNWVHNKLIPDFKNPDRLKDIGLQYVTEINETSPQLFVYSKSTGDFNFYVLTNDGWALNENIPAGRISIDSNNINASYTPPQNKRRSFIFSYSSEGQNIELLEIANNEWNQIGYCPTSLPK